MTLQNLITGLKNKTIIISGNHRTNSIIKELEDRLKLITDIVKGYEEQYAKTSFFNIIKKFSLKSLIKYYKKDFNVESGKPLSYTQTYCFDCGENMYLTRISETEVGYVPQSKYWDFLEEEKKKYVITKSDIIECKCCKQRAAKKLTSEIEIATGKLIVSNFFKTDELFYEDANQHFKEPSINCLLGRDNLMQSLAKKNVGYGQMGNMGVAVYANKTEVIILDYAFNDLENYAEEDEMEAFFEEHSYKDNIQDLKDTITYIKNNKMKYVGSLSLSVWRWQCADKSVLESYGEDLEKLHCDNFELKVEKGKYRIEHYFEFSNSCLYSKIKKI